MQSYLRWLFLVLCVLWDVTASSRGFCPSTVGRWSYGPSYAVASAGERVFFGSGATLMVATVGDDSEIEIVAELALPNIVMDLEIRNGIAAIAAQDSGLILVDVSHPGTPVLIGRLDTRSVTQRVALAGDLALIADSKTGLRIIDISDPTNPRELGSTISDYHVAEVAIVGDIAYAAADSAVLIIDISKPSDPVQLGRFQRDTRVNRITIHQDRAYIGSSWRGLIIYDIANPRDPVLLGEYDPGEQSYYAVVVHDDRVYLGEVGLTAVDVSDPTATVRTSYLTPGVYGNTFHDVAMHGDLLLAVAEGDGLRVINTGAGDQLVEVAAYDVPSGGNRIEVSGKTVYLASGLERGDGIRVFDVGQPSAPRLLGSTRDFQRSSGIYGLSAAGDLLYFVDPMAVIDVSDPTMPVASTYLDERARATEVSSGYLFTTSQSTWEPSELRVYDLADPLSPSLVGSVPVPGKCHDLVVEGGRAFVASGTNLDGTGGGLHIFDLVDPATPLLIGSLETGTSVLSLTVDGSHVYLGDRQILRIVDATLPWQPREVGSLRLDAWWPSATDIAVADGVALVADTATGFLHQQYVHVIDVSDPTAPRQRARLTIDSLDIEAANGLFYVADRDGGFRIIDPNASCPQPFIHDTPSAPSS